VPIADPEIFARAQSVGERLRQRGFTVAVAESCTAGLLGAALTDVPGSSTYFLGGVIAYANRIKAELLGVPEDLFRTVGAVSPEVAAAMAIGVRRLLQADLGVSITGVAGPGPEERKPAGLTFIGLAVPEPGTHRFEWTGDRWANRRQSVMAALDLLAGAVA
jgi:PncC family amidohydrolase